MSSFRRTLNAYHQGAITTTDGYRSQGEEVAFTITASVQPLRPSDLEALPEGRRENSAFRLYTNDALLTVESLNPDQVEIYGERYEVIGHAPWQNNVINHHKYIAMIVLED